MIFSRLQTVHRAFKLNGLYWGQGLSNFDLFEGNNQIFS